MTHVRERIRMTEEEVWAFLGEAMHVHIATLNADGSPHMVTMRFAVVERTIVFHSYAKAQKIRNLERDPRIAFLAEAGDVSSIPLDPPVDTTDPGADGLTIFMPFANR